MRWGKLYESMRHISNGPLGNLKFKMSGDNGDRLPRVRLSTGRSSKVGTFHDLINIFPPILIHKCYHFLSGPIV